MKPWSSAKASMHITLGLLLSLHSVVLVADSDREDKQAQLDAACEAVREKRIAPLRKHFVAECVRNKEQSSRTDCETFYADYGSRSGDRAPLFYDLPECVKAFEFQKSERQP